MVQNKVNNCIWYLLLWPWRKSFIDSKRRNQFNLTYIYKNFGVGDARIQKETRNFLNILHWIGSSMNSQKWTLKSCWGCDIVPSTWMQRPISPCSHSPRTACPAFSWSWLVFCSLCSGIFRAAHLPMQPVPLCMRSGACTTQLVIIFWQTSDLLVVVFPLQHYIAIPHSSVSKEPYDYNTSV